MYAGASPNRCAALATMSLSTDASQASFEGSRRLQRGDFGTVQAEHVAQHFVVVLADGGSGPVVAGGPVADAEGAALVEPGAEHRMFQGLEMSAQCELRIIVHITE